MSDAPTTSPVAGALECGSPADDSRAFRRCLGQYATGVSVITTCQGGERFGMAVNSFAAVSLDPALVLWSIRRESASAPAFLNASHFAVNVLAAGQVEVSKVFGSAQPDRFARHDWTAGLGQAPLLGGAIAHFECSLETVHEGGDHLILLGRVQRYARFEGEPLIFAQGQYSVSREHPMLAAKPEDESVSNGGVERSTFLRSLTAASQNLSAQFDIHRREFGVNVASGRVLSRLYEQDYTRAQLEFNTYLGSADLEDALRDLRGHEQIAVSESGVFHLTAAGRSKRESLARCASEFIGRKLQSLDPADVAAARRVLSALQ